MNRDGPPRAAAADLARKLRAFPRPDSKPIKPRVIKLPDELKARPGPGKWSIQEIVIHLVDSDEIAIDRPDRNHALVDRVALAEDIEVFAELA